MYIIFAADILESNLTPLGSRRREIVNTFKGDIEV